MVLYQAKETTPRTTGQTARPRMPVFTWHGTVFNQRAGTAQAARFREPLREVKGPTEPWGRRRQVQYPARYPVLNVKF